MKEREEREAIAPIRIPRQFFERAIKLLEIINEKGGKNVTNR